MSQILCTSGNIAKWLSISLSPFARPSNSPLLYTFHIRPTRSYLWLVLPMSTSSSQLLSVPEVLSALHSGYFKPNCGLILVDFLIRHGLVTPESEPNYIEIAWRMRRRLEVGVPM